MRQGATSDWLVRRTQSSQVGIALRAVRLILGDGVKQFYGHPGGVSLPVLDTTSDNCNIRRSPIPGRDGSPSRPTLFFGPAIAREVRPYSLKSKAETEMERAGVFVGSRIRIETVIQPDGTDG